jgi:transcriptional regulator with GAF, ATPase, and Fis domain
VQGSFTGADRDRPGLLELAHGGTLFLDEVGDMPLSMQVKLLRALQESEFERVGGIKTTRVDVRLIAATNRNLEEEIEAGRFRTDLFYRLNVVPVVLPPLRDRKTDIPMLSGHFIEKYNKKLSKKIEGISDEAMGVLQQYGWPGNIRELENRIKKAVVLADKALLGPEDLDLSPDDLPPILPLADAKDKFQRDYINEVLALNNGNRTKTARDLGVDPRTVFRHLEKEGGEPSDSPDGP